MPNPFCQIMVAKKLDDIKTKRQAVNSVQDKNTSNLSIKEIKYPNKVSTKK